MCRRLGDSAGIQAGKKGGVDDEADAATEVRGVPRIFVIRNQSTHCQFDSSKSWNTHQVEDLDAHELFDELFGQEDGEHEDGEDGDGGEEPEEEEPEEPEDADVVGGTSTPVTTPGPVAAKPLAAESDEASGPPPERLKDLSDQEPSASLSKFIQQGHMPCILRKVAWRLLDDRRCHFSQGHGQSCARCCFTISRSPRRSGSGSMMVLRVWPL